MADRNVPTSASPAPVTGPDYMDAVAEKLALLFGATPFVLTNIGGSANAITADVDPVLTGAVQNGMSFWLTPASNNSGTVTLAVNGGAAIDVMDDAGNALVAGTLKANQSVLLVALGGVFRALNTIGTQKINNYQVFTAPGTWNKPAGTANDAMVIVECFGGGGGGGNGPGSQDAAAGGGGGGYITRKFRAGDLSASVAVTVGAAGSLGNAGGNSTFGAYLTGYGGGGGGARTTSTNRAAGGGGGGGSRGAGGTGGNAGSNVNTATGSSSPGTGGDQNAALTGDGGAGSVNSSNVAATNTPVGKYGHFGGAGGGGGGIGTSGGTASGSAGGDALYGGGGGGGRGGSGSNGAGGVSIYAGNGGASGVAGTAPGGGGGANAVGARGEVRIHVIG